MRLLGVGFLLTTSVVLSGCAGFTFYSDKALTNETAIPIPRGKPHLLVIRTGAKDKPVEASIVYITDYSDVFYAKPNSGFGSSNLSLAFANGQMTAFGQQTDTKVPELITSLSGLITARAGADKTGAEAEAIRDTLQGAVSVAAIGQAADTVAKDIIAKFTANQLKGLTNDEEGRLKAAEAALAAAAAILLDPTKAPQHAAQVDIVRAQVTELGKFSTPTSSTPRDASLLLIAEWKKQLEEATKEDGPKVAQPAFELYEIVQEGGRTKLVPVTPGTVATQAPQQ
jgi:hypothetical protein